MSSFPLVLDVFFTSEKSFNLECPTFLLEYLQKLASRHWKFCISETKRLSTVTSLVICDFAFDVGTIRRPRTG